MVEANDVVTIGVHADLDAGATERDGKGCMEQFAIERVLVHPGKRMMRIVMRVRVRVRVVMRCEEEEEDDGSGGCGVGDDESAICEAMMMTITAVLTSRVKLSSWRRAC